MTGILYHAIASHSQAVEERAMLRNYGLEEDFVNIQGYAFSGGGQGIQRVDVSVDGGNSWRQATIQKNEAKGAQNWSWVLWKTMVPRTFVGREIVVKAVDDAYNTQVGHSLCYGAGTTPDRLSIARELRSYVEL